MYIALSLFLPYLIGLGLLVNSASPASLRKLPSSYQDTARSLSFQIILGISLNHLLMLLIRDLKISLITGGVLSVIGYCSAIVILRNNFTRLFKLGAFASIITLLAAMLTFLLINNSPLGWDARYLWFFHGKMIYYNNGFTQTAGWNNTAYEFSHLDYPKLIAILSAQFTCFTGYWNDYSPRLSLLALLVPVVLGVLSFISNLTLSSIYLYVMMFTSLNVYLFNGYMDAYLAIYACISMLFLCKWLEFDDVDDMLTGLAFLSITPLLKNEGMLYFLSAIIGIIISYIFYSNRKLNLTAPLKSKLFWCITVMLSLNIIVWALIKHCWGLKNDLKIGYNSIKIVSNRINDGSIFVIFKFILAHTNISVSILIFLLSIIIAVKLKSFYLKNITPCILTTSIYFFGILIIYLLTPHDLEWHISNSVYRTMMTVNLSIIVANYIVLRDSEITNIPF